MTLITKHILKNGMTCYVVPKPGYVAKQAAIVVKYGGADYIHILPDGSHVEMPPGIAHFLEHKMFEDSEVSMFDTFTHQGASTNAYTHFTHTVYYFSTTSDFQKNLETLFRLVNNPHFTEENVEKEKGIILSEIDMYADNPYWQMYTGLHRALFVETPLGHDILGTRKSVQSIKPSQLYDCYNLFYTPENMALICVGDFEFTQILEWAEVYGAPKATRSADSSIGKIPSVDPFAEKNMPVSIPLFQLGFRALYDKMADPITMAASGILADMIAGESSEIYSELYDKGMIDNQFSAEYIGGTDYGMIVISGASPQPETVQTRILQAIEDMKQHGLSQDCFNVIKSKHIGRYIRSLNSIETLSSIQADLFTKGQDISTMMDAFQKVSLQDVKKQFHLHINKKNCAISTIKP